MLFEMVLSWRLAPNVEAQHVSQLFKKARVWCKQQPVTGVLLFDGECLMGNFEAPRGVLRQMLNFYRLDARHTAFRLQHIQLLEARNYSDFQAGYIAEIDVVADPESSLTPLMALKGKHVRQAFRELESEIE